MYRENKMKVGKTVSFFVMLVGFRVTKSYSFIGWVESLVTEHFLFRSPWFRRRFLT